MKTKTMLAAACLLAMAPAAMAGNDKAFVESAAADAMLARLTLQGHNFLGLRNPVVRLSGTANALPILSASDVAITVLLPAGIPAGSYYLTLGEANGNSGNEREADEFAITIGARGATGPQGPQGAAGAMGAPGAAGEAVVLAAIDRGSAACVNGGARFAVGGASIDACNGAPGVAGAAGKAGADGASGPQGPQGDTGPAGPAGAQGAKGDAGAPGAIGSQGLKGDTGLAGAMGAQGAQGDQGPAGPMGLQGFPGPAIQVQGPLGPRGQTGPAGITGQAVVSYADASTTAVPAGGAVSSIAASTVSFPTQNGLGTVDAWVTYSATASNAQDSLAFCQITFTPYVNGLAQPPVISQVNFVASTTSQTFGVSNLPSGSTFTIGATTDCGSAAVSNRQMFVALIRR